MNKIISATLAIAVVLILAGVVGITIIEQWAQAEAAYQIEQVKKCGRSLPPGESFYGLLVPVNYNIEEVKCCNKKC
jgi:FlaG/FlaF family flagellin (archaellin)